ncbi:MgtC/SapB family protein [Nakamurella lactea]|uniref:MgtC/SapB family protein n=1 Tax=Nakamurella lactea TaxID=459515 RepID=UPI000420D46A|nr:MgtC/SapB family protein [Nakamurella lactea]
MDRNLDATLYILVALALCAVVGLERQWRQKSAGLRTHTLVGVGAALIMVVSKYGFFDVIGKDITLDPSRVAAQIVSGIGFIGGGLIFVRRDLVRGLTTAATIWLAAAVGMAAGAGLLLVATVVTGFYLVIALAFPPLLRLLPRPRFATSVLRLTYEDGRGLLRTIVQVCTSQGHHVVDLELARTAKNRTRADGDLRLVGVLIELEGPRDAGQLVQSLAGLEGVVEVGLAEGYEAD